MKFFIGFGVLLFILFPSLINGRPVGDHPHGRFSGMKPKQSQDFMTGMTGMPDMTGMPGMTGMPEMTGMPGMTGMPEMTMPEMPGMDMGHMMKMYFHKTENVTILFQQWETWSWQEMVGSCIGLGLIAFLYEGFKVARQVITKNKQTKRASLFERSNPPSYNDNQAFKSNGSFNFNQNNNIGFDDGRVEDGCCNPKCGMCSGWHWLQTLLHAIQVFVSYCLMLVFMTYNAWLCIAVVVGLTLGYFFFGWITNESDDPNDHCH